MIKPTDMIRGTSRIVITIIHFLFIGISCQKDQYENVEKSIFVFSKIRPSSYLASDGSFKLTTNNANLIDSIEWTKPGSNFKSFDINVNNLTAGFYYYRIIDAKGRDYYDSIFLASLDTIKPLEYFPAYPGSKWIYSNNDTIWCSDKYYKVPLFSDGLIYPTYMGYPTVPIDSIYVVNVHGVSCFESNNTVPYRAAKVGIMGYTYLLPAREFGITREQFFCETPDCNFGVSGYRPSIYGWTECKKIVNDTTITINSKIYPNTQVIRKVILNGGYGYKNIYLYYFAKDIGIIKCERAIDYLNSIYETEYEIVKYVIIKSNK